MVKEFITRSGYEPPYRVNFLRHWTNGQIPSGKEDHPVVYINLEDARAYALFTYIFVADLKRTTNNLKL